MLREKETDKISLEVQFKHLASEVVMKYDAASLRRNSEFAVRRTVVQFCSSATFNFQLSTNTCFYNYSLCFAFVGGASNNIDIALNKLNRVEF